jgi:hypothetical protein
MVGMFVGPPVDRYDVQISEPDPPLCSDTIGKGFNGFDGALKHGDLQTVPAVKMDVQCRDGQIPMLMLSAGQTTCEVTSFVLIDIGKGCDTWRFIMRDSLLTSHRIPDDIADGFRSTRVATPLAQRVDDIQKIIVDADRNALHGIALLKSFAAAPYSRPPMCR